jgi:hypothetical protein
VDGGVLEGANDIGPVGAAAVDGGARFKATGGSDETAGADEVIGKGGIAKITDGGSGAEADVKNVAAGGGVAMSLVDIVSDKTKRPELEAEARRIGIPGAKEIPTKGDLVAAIVNARSNERIETAAAVSAQALAEAQADANALRNRLSLQKGAVQVSTVDVEAVIRRNSQGVDPVLAAAMLRSMSVAAPVDPRAQAPATLGTVAINIVNHSRTIVFARACDRAGPHDTMALEGVSGILTKK